MRKKKEIQKEERVGVIMARVSVYGVSYTWVLADN